jgi:RNA polymerase sigma factor (sigma-70 family)
MEQDGTSRIAATAGSEAPRHPTHVEDLDLVRQVLVGDPSAWTRLVERYAGLILSVVRRYLRSGDRDDARSVFADILVSLRRSKLRTYEGRAALSTWLTLVARTETLDFLRRRVGRGRYARAMARLDPEERSLFHLFYLEGRSPHAIVDHLNRGGEQWTLDRFVASLRHIESRLGDAWMRRLAYDLHAQSVGAASGRMLEYLDHVRDEFEQSPGAYSPDYYLMEREARHTADRLAQMVGALDPHERDLLRLRFEQGWTAREIARELGTDDARGVYTTTDRIVRKLRRWLEGVS